MTETDQNASPNSDHVLTCDKCWKEAGLEGTVEITLGIIGTQLCTLCGTDITKNDTYHWMGRFIMEKELRKRHPMNVLKVGEIDMECACADVEEHSYRERAGECPYPTNPTGPADDEVENKGGVTERTERHVILKRLNDLYQEIGIAGYNISVMSSSPRTHSEEEILKEIDRCDGLYKEQSELRRKRIKLYPSTGADTTDNEEKSNG